MPFCKWSATSAELKKGVIMRIKLASPFKSTLKFIDRIWAQNGVVCIKDKEGKTHYKLVSQLKPQLQQMQMEYLIVCRDQPHLKAHYRELIEKLMEEAKKAMYQVETGEKGAVLTQRALKRETPDGKPVDETFSMDDNVEFLMEKFPGVAERVVGAVLMNADSFKEAEQELTRLYADVVRENGYALG